MLKQISIFLTVLGLRVIYIEDGTRKWECSKCGKLYGLKHNGLRHARVECGKEPEHGCNYCNFKTFYKSDIIRHMITCRHKKQYY